MKHGKLIKYLVHKYLIFILLKGTLYHIKNKSWTKKCSKVYNPKWSHIIITAMSLYLLQYVKYCVIADLCLF